MAIGNKGRFSERLKKIAFRKRLRKVEDNEEDNNLIYTNFLKVVAAIPGMIYGNHSSNILGEKKDENEDTKLLKTIKMDKLSLNNKMYMVDSKRLTNSEIRWAINDINVDDIKENQKKEYVGYLKKNKAIFDNKNNNILRAQKLEKSIIDIIKQRLIKDINAMEILQSDLYVLSEITNDDSQLKKCQEEIEHIKVLLERVRQIKDRYDFLKDNYDFEYLTQIDDNCLVDKIIELRDMFSNNEVKAVVDDYKLLDEYKYLYLKVDDLAEKMVLYEKEKQDKVDELILRNINFENFKNDVYNIDNANLKYNEFVKEQNRLIEEIDESVDRINNYEVVNYRLKGFNKLFLNTFKYFGLLMLNPLKGIIPSIATETLITKNLVHNLYKDLTWEEERKIVYETIDYSTMIKNAISDLEHTNNVVDSTLNDIINLKMKYNEQFKKYQGDSREYNDIMQKINDMEDKILGNKIKIELMRKKALEQEKANDRKLQLVNKLNSERS